MTGPESRGRCAVAVLAIGLLGAAVLVWSSGNVSRTLGRSTSPPPALEDLPSLMVCLEGPSPSTFGLSSFVPARTVRIRSVEIGHLDRAKVLDVRVGTPPGAIDMGTFQGFPPTSPGYPWSLTQPAEGAILEMGRRYNLIFGIDLAGATIGSASGVAVTYDDAGTTRTWKIDHVMAVPPKGSTCADNQAYLDALTPQ